MARGVPPLNPLRVFEVVARTGNLTAAGAELDITQSAVSRQIGVLESHLGVQLFRRERYGVSLTPAGRSYAAEISPAFERIVQATDKLVKKTSHGAVRIRTYTTVAAKWLIPLLGGFRERHPHIEVRISNAVADVDFDRDLVDLAIQFGDGRWPEVRCDLLFPDQIEPVCAPAYLSRHAPNPRYPESLLRQRLLVSRYRKADWDDWLQASALAHEARGAETMTFTSTFLAWQAAVDGLGIAMGQTAMLSHEFSSGALVRPFDRPMSRQRAYYLVQPRLQRPPQKVTLFREWLLSVTAPTREQPLALRRPGEE